MRVVDRSPNMEKKSGNTVAHGAEPAFADSLSVFVFCFFTRSTGRGVCMSGPNIGHIVVKRASV